MHGCGDTKAIELECPLCADSLFRPHERSSSGRWLHGVGGDPADGGSLGRSVYVIFLLACQPLLTGGTELEVRLVRQQVGLLPP